MASSGSGSDFDSVTHAQTQRTGRLQKSYIPQYLPYRPPMAMAERPFSILKVIVAAQFFSSCYFKVKKLHIVTLRQQTSCHFACLIYSSVIYLGWLCHSTGG